LILSFFSGVLRAGSFLGRIALEHQETATFFVFTATPLARRSTSSRRGSYLQYELSESRLRRE